MKSWYVVHVYSGHEKAIQKKIIEKSQQVGLADNFGEILIPVEEVMEIKSGQKSLSERKFFPGYILVNMILNDETWHMVKNIDKVTGFVGGSALKPTPISQKEVDVILAQMQDGVDKPKPKVPPVVFFSLNAHGISTIPHPSSATFTFIS